MQLILASTSPERLRLLKQIDFTPDLIIPPEIDETPKKGESAFEIAKRLCKEKAMKVFREIESGNSKYLIEKESIIIASDSVFSASGKILLKTESDEDVRKSLNLISGKRHTSNCGICVIKISDKRIIEMTHKVIISKITFKKLTHSEIDYFIQSKEGMHKAGGYSISGKAAKFISNIQGSVSSISGLPLHEIYKILTGMGYVK